MFHPKVCTPPRQRAHTTTIPVHGSLYTPNPPMMTLTDSISGLGGHLLASYYKTHIRSYSTLSVAQNHLLSIQSAADTLNTDVLTLIAKHAQEVQRSRSLSASLLNLRTLLGYWKQQAQDAKEGNVRLQLDLNDESDRLLTQLRAMNNANDRLENLRRLLEGEIGNMTAEMKVLRYQRDEAGRVNVQWQQRYDVLVREWNRVNARFRDEQVKNQSAASERALDRDAYETHIEVIEDKRKDDKKYIAMLEDKLIAMASTGASSAPSHEHKNSVENILTDMISASEREITTLQGITTGIQKTLPQDNNNNNNNNASFHAWIDAVQEAGPPSESSFQSLEEGFADDEQEEREEPEHRSISELNADSEPESDSVEFILSPRPLFTPAPLFTAQSAATAINTLRPHDTRPLSNDSGVDLVASPIPPNTHNTNGNTTDSAIDIHTPSAFSTDSSSDFGSDDSTWTLAEEAIQDIDVLGDDSFLVHVFTPPAAPVQHTTQFGSSPTLPFTPWTSRPVLGTPSTSCESLNALISGPANSDAFARAGRPTSPVFIIRDDEDYEAYGDHLANAGVVDQLDLLDALEAQDFGAVLDDEPGFDLHEELALHMGELGGSGDDGGLDVDAETLNGMTLCASSSPSSCYSVRGDESGLERMGVFGGEGAYVSFKDLQEDLCFPEFEF